MPAERYVSVSLQRARKGPIWWAHMMAAMASNSNTVGFLAAWNIPPDRKMIACGYAQVVFCQ